MSLIDMKYLQQNADAMRYIKLSAGKPAFYTKVTPLVHGDAAFETLIQELEAAKDEIYLASWMLEPDLELSRTNWDKSIHDRAQDRLDNILIARANAGVTIRILVWNYANLGTTIGEIGGQPVAINVKMAQVKKLGDTLRRISRRNQVIVVDHPLPFATRTVMGLSFPAGGSHHQKIWITRSGVKLTGLVGGINLVQGDWDTVSHEVLNHRRDASNTEGTQRKQRAAKKEDPDYSPRHDWMVRLEGPAAYSLLEEFSVRWGQAGQGRLPLLPLEKVPQSGKLFVQKSHTYPIDYGGGSHEILDAYKYAFARAQRYIYIENQYWTSEDLTSALAAQLSKVRNLEVVIVLPDKAEEPVVGTFIAAEQWYQLSRLWEVASRSRVRVYMLYRKHPVRPGYVNVYVHSKVAIIDDLWATIGSANTNNRSMIIDTECNVQIAHGPTVKAFRNEVWREMLEDRQGEADDAVRAIRNGWHPIGETNASLMEQGKVLKGLIVPLKEPKAKQRLPESLRPLL
jgi:phosphatidylserine/phosphatidylglycerophosphate/cardiolipin synthase-like enzyme